MLWTLRAKSLALGLPLLLLLAMAGVAAIAGYRDLQRDLRLLAGSSDELACAQRTRALLHQAVREAEVLQLTGSPVDRQRMLGERRAARAELTRWVDAVQQKNSARIEDELAAVQTVRRSADALDSGVDAMLDEPRPPGAGIAGAAVSFHRRADALLAAGTDRIFESAQGGLRGDQSLLRGDIDRMAACVMALVGLLALLLVVLRMFLARVIVNPLQSLIESAREVHNGNLSVRAKVDGDDEIAQLARVLNDMLDATLVATQSLRESHVQLEGRVRGRTAELSAANQALRDSEARYRMLFENNPQPMFVIDRETLGFLAVNDSATRHYGYSRDEFQRMTAYDLRFPEDHARLRETVNRVGDGMVPVVEARHRRRDGSALFVQARAHRLSFGGRPASLVLVHDLTEQRVLENQLRQTQKMEAMGRLAGGVAHDFNNVLTAISGYGEMIARRLDADSPQRRHADELLRATSRAAGLTRQLLAFSRKQVLSTRVLDLNVVVEDTLQMLRRLIGEDIDLMVQTEPALGRVQADPAQIEQVILNLVVNARDAMPTGGKLTLATENLDAEAGDGIPASGDAAGDGTAFGGSDGTAFDGSDRTAFGAVRRVALIVRDTGCGMDPETQARIFEPFFTTKEPGRGTGMGLATVYGIVQQSGGTIEVESAPGMGTTFRVCLPRVDAKADVDRAPETATANRSGRETILLVEDEAMVRALAAEVMREQGYTVLEANHGEEALAVAARFNGPIHLMLADVVMPQMGGREAAERLCRERPDLRVLYMSGYTDTDVVRHGVQHGRVAFLQKPFRADALLQQIREVLDEGERKAA